jgi:hypothetical protein
MARQTHQFFFHLFSIADVHVRSKHADDLAVRTTQGYLARKKRDDFSFGCCLGLFYEKSIEATFNNPAVIGSIQVGLISPPHLVIIFPNDVFRARKPRVAGEYFVAA